MKKLLKTVVWIAFALYLAVLGYVPFSELLQKYNTVLLIWCLLAVALIVLFAFVLLRFNRLYFIVFTALFAILHFSIFYIPQVKTSFDIDYCLDSDGVWIDDTCQKGG